MEVIQHSFGDQNGVRLVDRQDAAYDQVCQFVHDQYKLHFDCDLRHYMPSHLVLFEEDRIMAVAGIRAANTESLFLEQYLDESIEESILAKMHQVMDRSKIVEVGGFAARDHLSALKLMLQLSRQLDEMGFEMLVCAANRPIQKCLKLSGFTWKILGEVRPERVDHSANHWGKYYQSRPSLLAGVIAQSKTLLEARTRQDMQLEAVV